MAEKERAGEAMRAVQPDARPRKSTVGRPRRITEARERAKVPTGAMADMRELALKGDEWALAILCRVAATDLRELGANSDRFEVKDYFDIMSIVNPRKAVETYVARMGMAVQPKEEYVARAVGRLRNSEVHELRGKLEEIAGNSPYAEVREEARARLRNR